MCRKHIIEQISESLHEIQLHNVHLANIHFLIKFNSFFVVQTTLQCHFPHLTDPNAYVAVAGSLQVYVRYGVGLPDKDGFLAGRSDPYVSVTAVNNYGRQLTHDTQHVQGDHSPHWYQMLHSGHGITLT